MIEQRNERVLYSRADYPHDCDEPGNSGTPGKVANKSLLLRLFSLSAAIVDYARRARE